MGVPLLLMAVGILCALAGFSGMSMAYQEGDPIVLGCAGLFFLAGIIVAVLSVMALTGNIQFSQG